MKDLYNLIDQQLLSLLNAWAAVHERLMDDSLQIPDDGDDVPEIRRVEAEREIMDGLELAARNVISSAEDAHLISLPDWQTLNAIICNIGGDCPENAELLWWLK